LSLHRVSPNCSRLQNRSRSAIHELAVLAAGCAVLVIVLGCGSAETSQSQALKPVVNPPTDALIKLDLAPGSAALTSSDTLQFTATVQGTSNSAVKWSASAGSITSNGTFVAPVVKQAIQVTIVATSLADSSVHATSIVTISPAETPTKLQIVNSTLAGAYVNTGYTASLSASGGKPPYQWSVSSGSLPSGITMTGSGAVSGTTSRTGSFAFTVRVMDSASNSATQQFSLSVAASTTTSNSGYDGPAELPRVYLSTTMADTPAPGATINVAAGGSLQTALNKASCGDIIQLQAGATYSGGQITFPTKACDDQHWIIVRTSASDDSLPAEGTRLTPCYAGVTSLPGRPAFACPSSQKVVATISYIGTGDGPIIFANGANHYRLLGLEITRTTNDGKPVTALLAPEQNGAYSQIVFDRLYIHGTPTDETRRGVALSGGTSIAVQDSYLSDFHCNVGGTCTDSQAVSGGTGILPSGPYKISDNFLEAAGENVLFGGDHATQTPADIEVTRNHFFKPLIWMKGQPGYTIAVIIKNHFELKNAQRVLVDSNIMDNDWGGYSQYGASILITPKNQDINGESVCPLCQVTDVTVRYATISHVAGAFVIGNVFTKAGGPPLAGNRYSIHDIIADDINATAYLGHGTFAEVSTIAHPLLQDVEINHVTAFPSHTMFNVSGPKSVQIPGFIFMNSIVSAGVAPVWSTGNGGAANCAYYDIPLKTFNLCFTGYVFTHNAILESPYVPSYWPSENRLYTTSAIEFVNYNGGNGGDYNLLPSSPAIGAATDGTNLGANVDLVMSDINGVQ
jgi:hypothetical protein